MSKSTRIARVIKQVAIPVADIPTFLCPGILRALALPVRCGHQQPRLISTASRRRNWAPSPTPISRHVSGIRKPTLERLPQQCAGCGALSQTVDSEGPGYYTLTRKSVKTFVEGRLTPESTAEDHIVKAALESAGAEAADLNLPDFATPARQIEPPRCDRCHKLKHHETGVSIHHPTVQSLQDTIFESPYKYNHIYHVLDAADFPMSLVPGLQKLLHLTPQRSLNRRSKTGRFYHGRKTEVSFIITRSDLLAPQKTQVDSMMPYLRDVLREALGRSAKDVRLGNIRCVSAKQAWWTKELKEEIWKRGGGGWMVGKVNVGKSQLFHDVFPKGRRDKDRLLGKKGPSGASSKLDEIEDVSFEKQAMALDQEDVEVDSTEEIEEASSNPSLRDEFENSPSDSLELSTLLPPVPAEVDYPSMPLVSSLPGTTASPIRLSFGNGKGELIDLPGLSRGDLELHVQPEHRSSLVMRSRILPEQQVMKPGKSLLLGGFIRITPTTPDVIILAYAFTPIAPHLTSTEKAIGTQEQTRESNLLNIAIPGTGKKIKSAGTFHLKYDVTRQRTGPITSPQAVGLKPENLPYRVLSTDILIEGCGWVELVAQVRKRPGEATPIRRVETGEDEPEFVHPPEEEVLNESWPAVEVFTPEGKFVAARRPMNTWLNVVKRPVTGKLQGRPRKAMKGTKKVAKRGRGVVSARL